MCTQQVNVNPAYQVDEAAYALEKVGCKGIVASSKFKTQDYYGMLKQICPELEVCGPGQLKSKRCVTSLKTHSISETKSLIL